jgi:hypothetical protein
MLMCDYWWGTHACDLPDGHTGFHRCDEGPDGKMCSEYDGVKVRFAGEVEWRETGGGRVQDILGGGFTELFVR